MTDRPTLADRQLWMSMARLVTHLSRRASRALDAAESINLSQMTLLGQIRVLGGSARMVDLAALLQVTKPAITKMIGCLEGGGLVARSVDKSDRRVTRVALTAAGRLTLQRSERVFEDLMRSHLWQHLTPDDAARGAAMLTKIVAALGLAGGGVMPPRGG